MAKYDAITKGKKNPQNWLKSFREGLVSTYYQMWVLAAESFERKPFSRSFFPPLTGVANGFPLDLTRKSETFLFKIAAIGRILDEDYFLHL